MKLKEITHAQLKELRRKQLEKQDYICPILKQKIDFCDSVFDHKHKIKAEKIGEDGKGLLRGVLHRQCNVFEGKITRLFKRYGLHKLNISLPDALRNTAAYIENPPMKPKYIHPNERPKAKKLGKREYNLVCKYYFLIYPQRKKLPEYPKSGKINKFWEDHLKIAKHFKDQGFKS